MRPMAVTWGDDRKMRQTKKLHQLEKILALRDEYWVEWNGEWWLKSF